MSNTDDIETIPDPDDKATAEEQAHAKSFAALVDNLVAGKPTPPAMATEERELVTAATMIHACTTDVQLDPKKRDELVDKAFQQTLPENLRSVAKADTAASPGADITPLASRRRLSRAAPWLVAAVAAAAAVFFALNPVTKNTTRTTERATRPVRFVAQPVSAQHRSRPADPLIGRISTTNSAAASQRLDRIFSNRLSGYRDLRLRRRARNISGGKK